MVTWWKCEFLLVLIVFQAGKFGIIFIQSFDEQRNNDHSRSVYIYVQSDTPGILVIFVFLPVVISF